MAQGADRAISRAAKLWGYRDRRSRFQTLLDILGDCVAVHLIRQLEAGADAVQIFDSWACGLARHVFANGLLRRRNGSSDKVRAAIRVPGSSAFPVPRPWQGYEDMPRQTGVDAVSLDTAAPMPWAAENWGTMLALQGNLDPIALIAGGERWTRQWMIF